MVWEEMSFEEFQDGRHLGYRNGTILVILNLYVTVILNLYVTVMPPIVSTQSHMVWEEMSFEEFQDGHHEGHLGYWNGTILAILKLYVTTMPPIKFRQSV